MTKKDYLNILEKDLHKLEYSDKLNILNFYDEYFRKQVQINGKTELDVIRELGNPHKLAASILEDKGIKDVHIKVKTPKKKFSLFLFILDVPYLLFLAVPLFTLCIVLFFGGLSSLTMLGNFIDTLHGDEIQFFQGIYILLFLLYLSFIRLFMAFIRWNVNFQSRVFLPKASTEIKKSFAWFSLGKLYRKFKILKLIRLILIAVAVYSIVSNSIVGKTYIEDNLSTEFTTEIGVDEYTYSDVEDFLFEVEFADVIFTSNNDTDEIIITRKYIKSSYYDEVVVVEEGSSNNHAYFILSVQSDDILNGLIDLFEGAEYEEIITIFLSVDHRDEITVSIPDSMLESVEFHVKDGYLSIEEISVKHVTGKVDNGSVSFFENKIESFDLNISNGDFMAGDNEDMMDFHVYLSNGDFTYKDSVVTTYLHDYFNVEVANGNIVIHNVYMKYADCTTQNGFIDYFVDDLRYFTSNNIEYRFHSSNSRVLTNVD